MNSAIIYGNYDGKLKDSGDTITLKDGSGVSQIAFFFNGDWHPLAKGLGASLELICDSADPSSMLSWRPSALPTATDANLEYVGTPGARSQWYSCPAPAYIYTPKVFINEIQYRPYKENTLVSRYEYIELYNGLESTLSLDNWRIVTGSRKANSVQVSLYSLERF